MPCGGDVRADVDDDQPLDALGMHAGEADGYAPAHGQPEEQEAAEPEVIRQPLDVGGHGADRVVGARGPLAIAVAPLVQRDHAVARLERAGQMVPGTGVARDAVQQHERARVRPPPTRSSAGRGRRESPCGRGARDEWSWPGRVGRRGRVVKVPGRPPRTPSHPGSLFDRAPGLRHRGRRRAESSLLAEHLPGAPPAERRLATCRPVVRNVVTPAGQEPRPCARWSGSAARRKARSSMRQRSAPVPRYFFGGFQNWSTSSTTSNTVFWSLPSLRSTLRR